MIEVKAGDTVYIDMGFSDNRNSRIKNGKYKVINGFNWFSGILCFAIEDAIGNQYVIDADTLYSVIKKEPIVVDGELSKKYDVLASDDGKSWKPLSIIGYEKKELKDCDSYILYLGGGYTTRVRYIKMPPKERFMTREEVVKFTSEKNVFGKSNVIIKFDNRVYPMCSESSICVFASDISQYEYAIVTVDGMTPWKKFIITE